MRHRRRRRLRFRDVVPLAIAAALIIAAFVVAPALQAPPPRSAWAPGHVAPVQAAISPSDGPPATAEGRPATTEGPPATVEKGRVEPTGRSGVTVKTADPPRAEAARATAAVPQRKRHSEPTKRKRPPQAARRATEASSESGDVNVRWNRAND